MQVKKDIIGILRKKQETINENINNIITGLEEKMNIENLTLKLKVGYMNFQ